MEGFTANCRDYSVFKCQNPKSQHCVSLFLWSVFWCLCLIFDTDLFAEQNIPQGLCVLCCDGFLINLVI